MESSTSSSLLPANLSAHLSSQATPWNCRPGLESLHEGRVFGRMGAAAKIASTGADNCSCGSGCISSRTSPLWICIAQRRESGRACAVCSLDTDIVEVFFRLGRVRLLVMPEVRQALPLRRTLVWQME